MLIAMEKMIKTIMPEKNQTLNFGPTSYAQTQQKATKMNGKI